MIFSKSELEIKLEKIERFENPKLILEQYRLPAPLAAEILWYIQIRFGDIAGNVIADLGCGTGILGIGCALLNADYVIGVDIDSNAIKKARKTSIEFEVSDRIDFIVGDIKNLNLKTNVVIQNPPFGVRKKGADRDFIIAALRIAPKVYSIHKGGEHVRKFIIKFVEQLGGKVVEEVPLKIKLPPSYHFHKKKFHVFEARLYKIVRERL